MFGYAHVTGGYEGGQADYVRVPFGERGGGWLWWGWLGMAKGPGGVRVGWLRAASRLCSRCCRSTVTPPHLACPTELKSVAPLLRVAADVNLLHVPKDLPDNKVGPAPTTPSASPPGRPPHVITQHRHPPDTLPSSPPPSPFSLPLLPASFSPSPPVPSSLFIPSAPSSCCCCPTS